MTDDHMDQPTTAPRHLRPIDVGRHRVEQAAASLQQWSTSLPPLQEPPDPVLDLPPIDPLLLAARTAGTVEWLCPSCSRLNRTKPDRNGRTICAQLHCRRRWLVGVVMRPLDQHALAQAQPWSAVVSPMPAVHDWINHRPADPWPPPASLPALARLAGPIEYRCPGCHQWNNHYAQWDDSTVDCDHCRSRFVVSVHLQTPPSTFRRTPPDWIAYVQLPFPRSQRLRAHSARARRPGPTAIRSGPGAEARRPLQPPSAGPAAGGSDQRRRPRGGDRPVDVVTGRPGPSAVGSPADPSAPIV